MTNSQPRILLVEDNELNRDMLTRRLARRGFSVEVAVDGEQALNHVRSAAPDLVLMDMSLPVLDGYETTLALKSDPSTAQIPIIALTAHAMADDEARCRDAGCDDYATKPTDLDDLVLKMHALLGTDRQ